MTHLEALRHEQGVYVTDVWFPEPEGRTLRVVAGIGSRVHVGEPKIRLSDGSTIDMTRHR